MEIRLLGGLRVEHDGAPVAVTGSMQRRVLFRLAVDADAVVSVRELIEDCWGLDAPENERGALQSVISRLRAQLPPDAIESAPGGYRLAIPRHAVDALAFEDAVAGVRRLTGAERARAAARALARFGGEPWIPDAGFDWFARDVRRDRTELAVWADAVPPAEVAASGFPGPATDPAATAGHPTATADPATVADPRAVADGMRSVGANVPGILPPSDARPASTPAPAGTAEDGGGPRPRDTRRAVPPAPLTALIGRDDELARIRAQLAANRLVTLIGTGGAGKTRLAVEIAREQDDAVFVALAPVDAAALPAAVLSATGGELRTRDSASDAATTLDRLRDALTGREVLLVLDNCEHVLDAAAELAIRLLGELPRLTVLTTSREPLDVAGEAFVPLGPLAHPADGEPLAAVAAYPAVELFAQRAAAARGQGIDDAELPRVAEICAALDGLPLAIELAAAKLRTMTVAEVLDGLEHRFALLDGGLRGALPRHQTLRAMIDWSWTLLGDDERVALRRVSLLPGGLAASDAGAVAEALELDRPGVFDALVDRSLLQRVAGRFRALETVREYGLARLAETDDPDRIRLRLARSLLERAQAYDAATRSPGIARAIAWFDDEQPNLLAALRFCSDPAHLDPELAVALVAACLWYWAVRDRDDLVRVALDAVGPIAAQAEGTAARIVSVVHPLLTRFEDPAAWADPAVAGELRERIAVLEDLELPALTSDLEQVVPVLLRAVADALGGPDWMLGLDLPTGEQLGLRPWPTAMLHVVRSALAQNRGDIDALDTESAAALRLFRAEGDLWGLAFAQQARAEWLRLTGRLEEAVALSDDAVASRRAITDGAEVGDLIRTASFALIALDRAPEAVRRAREALSEERRPRGRELAQLQYTAAAVEAVAGDPDRASAILDEAIGAVGRPSSLPPQFFARTEALRGLIALARDDLAAARGHIRLALDAAVTSHDHPVIGEATRALAELLLAEGDERDAERALDIAAAITGAREVTSPRLARFERRLQLAASARESAPARDGAGPSRPKALELLSELRSDQAFLR